MIYKFFLICVKKVKKWWKNIVKFYFYQDILLEKSIAGVDNWPPEDDFFTSTEKKNRVLGYHYSLLLFRLANILTVLKYYFPL